MTTDAEAFEVNNKKVFLYRADRPDSPLIVMNEYTGDGRAVIEQLKKSESEDCSVLVVSGLDWDSDMSPWYCPPVFPGEGAYEGRADAYLDLLLTCIIPEAGKLLDGKPAFTGIAGYSLAGLFSLYALYRCDAFDCAASMSGSMWFPGFVDFVREHDMKKRPDRIYLSLGSKEAKTRNPYMKEVQNCTESVAEIYREQGLDVTWELNPGNHFRDVEIRCSKGVRSIAGFK